MGSIDRDLLLPGTPTKTIRLDDNSSTLNSNVYNINTFTRIIAGIENILPNLYSTRFLKTWGDQFDNLKFLTDGSIHSSVLRYRNMIVERFDLSRLNLNTRIQALSTLEPGDSIFFNQLNEAQSMRVLSYYFLRTRNLGWRFTFKKIDNGWRLIRIHWIPSKFI